MTRLAGITTIYAIIAALALSAPLSASEAPQTSAAAGQPATGPEEAAAGDPQSGSAQGPGSEAAPEGQQGPDSEPPGSGGPAAGDPASGQPAPDSGQPAPASGQPAPASPFEPAPAQTAPAASEPQQIRDDAPAGQPKPRAAASGTVTIRDFEFAPASVTIDVGDTVTWSNEGPTPHSATAKDGSFDTGLRGKGKSRSHTFDAAGTFSYICTPHPFMKGTVTVRAASSGSDQEGSGGETGGNTEGGSTAGQAAGGSEADSGPSLPSTGLDAGGLALLGLLTLALGAGLRRLSQ
jgi:plastocyanin